jgi:hypothetical protein
MTTAYKFGHGGHVGGHLRDAFEDFIDGPHEEHFHNGKQLDLLALTGMLWNCTDVMPGDLCDALDLPRGATYARGARKVRTRIIRWTW